MGLKKCPICGELFADTYKHCPFCEEDENPRKARQPKRYGYGEGGRRLARRNYEEDLPRPLYGDEDAPRRSKGRDDDAYDADDAPRRSRRRARDDDYDDYDGEDRAAYRGRRGENGDYDDYDDYDDGYRGRRARYDDNDDDQGSPWFKIVMVILIAIIIVCLLYLGRGFLGNLLPGGNDDPTPPSSMSSDEPQDDDDLSTNPDEGDEPQVDEPDADEPDDPAVDPDEETTSGEDDAAGPLTLSHTDVSISGDESFTLTARSGSGSTTYTSADPAIASVSSAGVVTGLKKGSTEITVRRGSASAVCIVRVKSDGSGASSSGSGAASLNRTDMTLSVGESFSLKVSGVTTALTWSVADSSVATVDGSGKVTGVKSGTTRVTASWDGSSASCIVRVK